MGNNLFNSNWPESVGSIRPVTLLFAHQTVVLHGSRPGIQLLILDNFVKMYLKDNRTKQSEAPLACQEHHGPIKEPLQYCNICSNFTNRTWRSWPNHSQGSCEWVDCDLEVLWVELKQILHSKAGWSDFGPVRDRDSLPYPIKVLSIDREWTGKPGERLSLPIFCRICTPRGFKNDFGFCCRTL